MSFHYRCDRCRKDVSGEAVWEVAIRVKNVPPEAQYTPPKSFDLCGPCLMDLERFKKQNETNVSSTQ